MEALLAHRGALVHVDHSHRLERRARAGARPLAPRGHLLVPTATGPADTITEVSENSQRLTGDDEDDDDEKAGKTVFYNQDLLHLIMPDILSLLYDNADAASACEEAVRWCQVNHAGSCTGRDDDWKRLTKQVFGANAPTLNDKSVQHNFKALCTRTAAYRNGQRSLRNKRDDARVRGFVLAAVTQNGLALVYAHRDLRADPEIVLAAVKQNGLALDYASEDLKADPAIVRTAVTQNGLALVYASEDLKADPAIVRTAVTQNGLALRHASEDLKSDPAIVRTAVTQDGDALDYASEDLKSDPAIVRTAVTQNAMSLVYASEDLKSDPAIVRKLR